MSLYILQIKHLEYEVKAFRFVFAMQILSSRSSGLREDGKVGNRDTAAGDPPGLRDQVSVPASNHYYPGLGSRCIEFDVLN